MLINIKNRLYWRTILKVWATGIMVMGCLILYRIGLNWGFDLFQLVAMLFVLSVAINLLLSL